MSARAQSMAEEIANSLSHGLGLLAAMMATPLLILVAARQAGGAALPGALVFSAGMMLVFLSSTLYHAWPESRARQLLLRLDHAAIYLFIAASYTPFALAAPANLRCWPVLALVWGIALAGVLLKALGRLSRPLHSTGLYLLMGWLVLLAAYPLAAHLTATSLGWLLGGGLAYTVGAGFFALDGRLRFGHLVWHLFVLLGSGCHFLAVFYQAAG